MPARDPLIARAVGDVRRSLAPIGRCGEPCVVAVSGGPDSMALLGLIELVVRGTGTDVVVAHVDHGLRPESEAEAEFVRQVAGARGHDVQVVRLRLPPGPGLPARARDARYTALAEVARARKAQVCALGHTATDQAETMLLHLARGAGLRGTAGMRGARLGPDTLLFVRPLLAWSRAQTREMSVRLGLAFVDDPTNAVRGHPRVRIRSEVLPVLRELNPHVDRAFADAAALLQDADDAVAVWAERERGARFDPGTDSWRLEGWAELPRAIRTRVIQAMCEAGGVSPRSLNRDVIERIDAAVGRGPQAGPRSFDLHPWRVVSIARGQLAIRLRAAAAP